MNVAIPAGPLRCLLSNALLFAPAKGQYAVVRFRAEPNLLHTVATDGYVLAINGVPCEYVGRVVEFSLSLADAKSLLKMIPTASEDAVLIYLADVGDPVQPRAQFTVGGSSAGYSLATQEFASYWKWIDSARSAVDSTASMRFAPQLLAKIGRADPYSGQGKPEGWGDVANVTLEFTRAGQPALWTYGEYLHGLVKPLNNQTLGGDEVAGPSRKKKAKPTCPKCGKAELMNGREMCQACRVVESTKEK